MQLAATLDAIQAGARVRFVVHLLNHGEQPVTLPQSQQDAMEVSVRRNDAELWRWTAGIRQGSGRDTAILPNDRIRWFCEWPDPSFGTYTAVATVTVGEQTVQADSPVTVTKRVAEAATSGPTERDTATGAEPHTTPSGHPTAKTPRTGDDEP